MGTKKFGWCLDGQHDDCWKINGGLICECECHGDLLRVLEPEVLHSEPPKKTTRKRRKAV